MYPQNNNEFAVFELQVENYLLDSFFVESKKPIYFQNENVRFNLISVNDERCPQPLLCFWEGNATVGFRVVINDSISHIFLNTFKGFSYDGYSNDTTLMGYNIALLGLEPYPHLDSIYVLEDYRAKLHVE